MKIRKSTSISVMFCEADSIAATSPKLPDGRPVAATAKPHACARNGYTGNYCHFKLLCKNGDESQVFRALS